MQFDYCGIDKKAWKILLFPACKKNLKLPLNYDKSPFSNSSCDDIRAIDLLKFNRAFIASEGIVFKGFALSGECIFQEEVWKKYRGFLQKFHFFRRNYFKRKTIKINKAFFFCDTWSLINYNHWLCDALTRLQAGFSWLESDAFIVIPYEKYSIKTDLIFDSLRAFGIDKNRVILLEKETKLFAQEIVMPSHVTQFGSIFFRSQILKPLRERLLKINSLQKNLGERIYISRAKALYRKIANEDAVVAMLKKYDFVIINAEDYSFSRQVSICNHAKILISCHGAGLTNLMFMPENNFVIELINERMNRAHFYALASALDMNYIHLKCPPINAASDSEDVDILVDIAQLEKQIEMAIRGKVE